MAGEGSVGRLHFEKLAVTGFTGGAGVPIESLAGGGFAAHNPNMTVRSLTGRVAEPRVGSGVL